jgi:hypothetical protein
VLDGLILLKNNFKISAGLIEKFKVNVNGKPFGFNDLSIFTTITNGFDPWLTNKTGNL